jgi:ribosomal protein S18 acetylase RimI-like enzyme
MVYAMRGWGYCSGLFIDKSHRGKGIGTSLMQEAMRQLVKRRIYHFSFSVDARNTKALKFHKKLGFQRGFDSICMYKTLRTKKA